MHIVTPALQAAFWLIVFPMLAQFVYLSFGPEPRWPMWAQGALVPHYELTPGCNGMGTGPCATCKKGAPVVPS